MKHEALFRVYSRKENDKTRIFSFLGSIPAASQVRSIGAISKSETFTSVQARNIMIISSSNIQSDAYIIHFI